MRATRRHCPGGCRSSPSSRGGAPIDLGFGHFTLYASLTAAYALAGKMDEAKIALAEAGRLEPKLTVKWLTARPTIPPIPNLFEGLRKAGLPEE